MGLDNGIRLKSKTRIEAPDYVKLDSAEPLEDADFPFVYEICYWRKCWNVRKAIFDIIGKDENDSSEGVFDLTANDCRDIAVFLSEYFEDPEVWDDDQSFWTFDEIKERLLEEVINLHWLAKVLKTNAKCYAEFYDSY